MMMKSISSFFLTCLLLAAVLSVHAQSVIFPQEEQPGEARLSEQISGTQTLYLLENDLFAATFIHDDGKLFFGGCDKMGLKGGTELFSVLLGNGKEISTSGMQLDRVQLVDLPAQPDGAKGSLRFAGKALEADYRYGSLQLTWRAVLRDGSHYLRTELELKSTSDISMNTLKPMIYTIENKDGTQMPAVIGNTRGAVIASDRIFAGLETPMGINTVEGAMSTEKFAYQSWTGTTFSWIPGEMTPEGILQLGLPSGYISGTKGYLAIKDAGRHTVKFQYTNGSHRLDIAGIDVINPFTGEVVAKDYHKGTTGGSSSKNTYTLDIPEKGYYLVRYFRDCTEEVTGAISGSFNSNGTITWSGKVSAPEIVYDADLDKNDIENGTTLHLPLPETTSIQGEWRRQTTLKAGKTWKVSAVVGLIAKGQARRSFLAYSERERTVPWRPFPVYNSWFELNINRNNDPNYTNNYNEAQCLDVLNQWKTNLFDRYGTGIASFVWDDGWDQYGTWTFNKNFPNGFQKLSETATAMNSQIGAWLGPVGGYGESGSYRRSYWSNRGGMQLSNPAYYDVFLTACTKMVNDYAFNFFKFDGISAQFSSVGPDAGVTGEENAEAIIDIERQIRKIKPDIFINTTVGTWASPFWFNVSDAVWRQENDFGTIGNQGSDRDRWITYRDRLVYQNFVVNSPLCPINTLMTHGFILTKYGNTASERGYNAVLRELRCAFACGSGMVEVYADYSLMNNINNGKLWSDLAECIEWQREQSDVLPDVHWVGGNPWDGSKANVYGWASWNGKKATLALRNPSASRKTFKTTLREALDIPDYIHTMITLTDAFNQSNLSGLTKGEPIDIDTELSLSLPALSVFVYNGIDHGTTDGIQGTKDELTLKKEGLLVYTLSGQQIVPAGTVNRQSLPRGIYIKDGRKVIVK